MEAQATAQLLMVQAAMAQLPMARVTDQPPMEQAMGQRRTAALQVTVHRPMAQAAMAQPQPAARTRLAAMCILALEVQQVRTARAMSTPTTTALVDGLHRAA